jgi:hypothetical protein
VQGTSKHVEGDSGPDHEHRWQRRVHGSTQRAACPSCSQRSCYRQHEQHHHAAQPHRGIAASCCHDVRACIYSANHFRINAQSACTHQTLGQIFLRLLCVIWHRLPERVFSPLGKPCQPRRPCASPQRKQRTFDLEAHARTKTCEAFSSASHSTPCMLVSGKALCLLLRVSSAHQLGNTQVKGVAVDSKCTWQLHASKQVSSLFVCTCGSP